MFSALAAQMLRDIEVDAIAVSERSDLRSISDDDILSAAVRDGRVVVTFNYRDFILLDKQRRGSGHAHNGIVIVNSRRFSNSKAGMSKLVAALEELTKGEIRLNGIVTWL